MTHAEFGGIAYSIGTLSAMKQFHVSRKIAAIIPALLPLYSGLAKGGNVLETLSESPELLKPMADALAEMPDDTAEYIVATCMSAVKRQQGTAWVPVWSAGGQLFDDMDLGVLLPLTVKTIVANLGPFISGLLTSQSSSPESQAQPG